MTTPRRFPGKTTRRWLARVLLVVLAGACRSAGAPMAADVRIVDVFAQGADASSPLVVWIHGRGGTPERFASWWRDFPAKVEVALPQGFTAIGDGWSWFDYSEGTSDDDLARAVGAAAERLWRAIMELAHGRKSISITSATSMGMASTSTQRTEVASISPGARFRYTRAAVGFAPVPNG